MLVVGPLSAAAVRISRAGLPLGKTCLSLTSRAVSSKATETPFTSRACPDSGALEEVSHDHRLGRAKRAKPGPLCDPLPGGRDAVDLLAGAPDPAGARAGQARGEEEDAEGRRSASSIPTRMVDETRLGGSWRR